MIQTKDQLEKWYANPDPWSYQSSEDDRRRLEHFTKIIHQFGPYEKMLDIGAGEGWLTAQYPVPIKHGFELSDTAAARFPASVKRVLKPDTDYDLITATGVFYPQYDWSLFLEMIKASATKHVLVSSIAEREHCCVARIGTCLWEEYFDYEAGRQRTRLFKVIR